MLESIDWNEVLNLTIKIIGTALGSILITLSSILFAKLKGKIADSRLYNFIDQTVRAAEQLYPNTGKKMGKEKYKYVLDRVLEKYPKLTENEYLKSLIEGAVYAVSEQTRQRKAKHDKKNEAEEIKEPEIATTSVLSVG